MWKDFLYYTKTERQGIIVLVVLILGVYAAPELFAFFTRAEDTDCTENEKSPKDSALAACSRGAPVPTGRS